MKNSTIVTILICVGVYFYLNNDSGNNKPTPAKRYSPSDSVSEKNSLNSRNNMPYSLRATANTWPSSTDNLDAIAPNLLTTNYYMVLDGSGSMADRQCSGNQTKLEAAKDALSAFADRIPGDANIGLYVFDANGRSERVPLGPNNKERFTKAVRDASANRGTPLKSAITAGYQALSKQANDQLGYGEYHLVVVTDGQASGDAENPSRMVRNILVDSPVVIHTIGFCIDDNHSLNQPGYTYYKSAQNTDALRSGLDQVLAEAPDFNTDSFSEN